MTETNQEKGETTLKAVMPLLTPKELDIQTKPIVKDHYRELAMQMARDHAPYLPSLTYKIHWTYGGKSKA